MKQLTTLALLIGGTILVSPSAFGQNTFIANDLYMGFQNQAGNATADYIINLGPASGIVGGTSVVTLTSYFSLANFNAVLGASSSMFGGVVGGDQYNTPDLYATQLRSGGAGNPAVPGSTMNSTPTRSTDGDAASTLSGMNAPAEGTGILDTSKTWEAYVEPTFTSTSFYGTCNVNPDSAIGSGGVLYEDLWFTSNNKLSGGNPWVYQGYFTLDLSGAPKLTFTPKDAAPSLTSPAIASVQKAGNTVTVISSNAVPTHTYQLEYTTNLSLTPISWNPVSGSSVVAGSTMVTNTDTSAMGSPRFYHVKAQ